MQPAPIIDDFITDLKLRSIAHCLELRHFDGVDCTFVTLVAVFASASVERLLHVECGEQSVDYRNLALGVESCDTVGHALTDVVEVWSLTLYHASQDDDGVVSAVESHLVVHVSERERH